MSREQLPDSRALRRRNQSIVRASYEALNRRDVAAWLATFHPDAELHPFGRDAHTTVFRGHDGLRQWVESVIEATEEFRFEPTQYTTAGRFVVARVGVRARQPGAATPLNIHVIQVFELAEGRVQGLSTHLAEGQTVEAMGLRD